MTVEATAMPRWVFNRFGAADEDRIAFGVEEGGRWQVRELALHRRRIGEDELVEIFEDGNLASCDAITDRAGLTVGAFSLHQAGDEG